MPVADVFRRGRLTLEPAARPALLGRILRFAAATSVAAVLLEAWDLPFHRPDLGAVLALAGGIVAVAPRRLARGLLWLPALVVSAVLSVRLGLPPGTGGGLVAGLALTWVLSPLPDRLGPLHGALGGAAVVPTATWLAAEVGGSLPTPLSLPLQAMTLGLAGAALLPVLALAWAPLPRIPRERQIRRLLAHHLQGPVLRAREHLKALSAAAPDRATADGLAEIVSWIWLLSRAVQEVEEELARANPAEAAAGVEAARAAVEQAADAAVRDRRLAVLRHREAILEHREFLVLERERAWSLVEYALASLEEARARMALVRTPESETHAERLPEVLDRLRTHATHEVARRRANHEVAGLVR